MDLKHLPGGALSGAAKGAAAGVVVSVIAGKEKKKAKKAVRNAAIFGGIVGALKRGQARRDVEERRQAYPFEMEVCMRTETRSSGSAASSIDSAPVRRDDAPVRRDDAAESRDFDTSTGMAEGAFNLDSMTCWDAISIPEEERAYALLSTYGFVAGKRNESIHSGEKISSTLSTFGKACQSPDMLAAVAIAKALTDAQVSAQEEFNLTETTCWRSLRSPKRIRPMLRLRCLCMAMQPLN